MIVATVAVTAAYALLLLIKYWLTLARSRQLPPGDPGTPLPDGTLSIVQAILSGDPLLESRLATNLAAHPGQSFIWLVDEDDTEGRRIAANLQSLNPSSRLLVHLCRPCPDRINPKLWKLRLAPGLAGTDFFCVLDDDTTLPSGTAAALVLAASRHSVATGLPFYRDAGDLPSALLSQFVNNNSAFTYLGTARLLAPFTLNGMGYVMRRDELARIGDFEPILHHLTDDFSLALLFRSRGGDIHQSQAPLQIATGVRDFRHYLHLMHRWHVFTLLLLLRQPHSTRLLIFLMHGLPPLLLLALAVLAILEATLLSLSLVASLLLLRGLVISALTRSLSGTALHRPVLSVVSELLLPFHLVHALLVRTIRWRSRRYRVQQIDSFTEA